MGAKKNTSVVPVRRTAGRHSLAGTFQHPRRRGRRRGPRDGCALVRRRAAAATTRPRSMETPQAAAKVPASSCNTRPCPDALPPFGRGGRKDRDDAADLCGNLCTARRGVDAVDRPRPVCVDYGVISRRRCHGVDSCALPPTRISDRAGPSMSSQASSAVYGPPSEPRASQPRPRRFYRK